MKALMNLSMYAAAIMIVSAFAINISLYGQIAPPSQLIQTMDISSSLDPEYTHSQNIAILNNVATNTVSDQFECFSYDSTYYMIVKEKVNDSISGFRFYDVNNCMSPKELGRIDLPDGYYHREIEVVQYPDSLRIIFYARNNNDYDLYLDILYEDGIASAIDGNEIITVEDTATYNIVPHYIYDTSNMDEMMVHHDGALLCATNAQYLRYFNIKYARKFEIMQDIMLNSDTACTYHDQSSVYNHEVKAVTGAYRNHVVGIGVVRSGMRLLTFNQEWEHLDSMDVMQYYDHDRTLLGNIILNPYKDRWDTTTYMPVTDERNNKWDYRNCHSVLPYNDAGNKYVLTIDEFRSSNSGQNQNGDWISELWEGIDWYYPNRRDPDSTKSYKIYYNHMPVINNYTDTLAYDGWKLDGLAESSSHRLNYNHRNHPKYLDVDPMRLQGAFLRIWDRDELGINDTTASSDKMLLNAYDVEESDARPEGFIGIDSIPEVADVPTGLHEPILHGNMLYLAGYNSGARILELNGPNITVKAYCRTEGFLSNDTSDAHFYLRPDIIMYAKGVYRLVPDTNRPGIVYGGDIYNGMWIYKYYDSTLVDTIRHIPFQTSIRIGTISANDRRRYHIAEGGAVVDSGCIVELVDNTDIVWDGYDSLVVDGELHIGSVYFDSSSQSPQRNMIYCSEEGVIYIGGQGKTISGWLNMHVAPGGRIVIKDGTTLSLVETSQFIVEGDLTMESCSVSPGCRFIARDHGRITFDTAATIAGLKNVVIADMGSELKFRVIRT